MAVDHTTTRFLYDGLQAIGEYNTSGALQRRYVPGAGLDEHLAMYEGSGTSDRRYFIQDERGSVVATADGAGAASAVYSYDEYGVPNSWTGARFRYTGQMMLQEARLYHYRARVYSPALGRFLQTDPVGYAGEMNLYAYVADDPINWIDPLGLWTINVGIEGEATYGVGVSGGVGVAISFPDPWFDTTAHFDAGVYGFVSGRVGGMVGAGPTIGVSRGSVQDMRGVFWDVTLGIGPGAVSVSGPITADLFGPGEAGFGRELGELRGPSGARVRTTSAGLSGGIRAQTAFTWRDVFAWPIWDRIFASGSSGRWVSATIESVCVQDGNGMRCSSGETSVAWVGGAGSGLRPFGGANTSVQPGRGSICGRIVSCRRPRRT